MRKGLVVTLLFVVFFSAVGLATEIVVTSTADSGSGSLRWALQTAQSGDTITFDPEAFPPLAPTTIYPRSELPPINCGNVTVDASDAGVIIDGTNVPGDWNNGLQVYSDHNTVMGLQIVNFAGSGIAVCSGSHNTIGGDRSIGSGPVGQGNLLSGNTYGIDICDYDTAFNVIRGNLVGTDASGTAAWGNRERGIWLEEPVHNNTIGPDNIIAYNGIGGVAVSGDDTVGNTITRNSIHSNGGMGINLEADANHALKAPFITRFDLGTGVVSGTTCANCEVEVFSDDGDEGKYYEGSTGVDASGSFVYQGYRALSGPHITTTCTDDLGNTSRFSLYTVSESGSASLQAGSQLPVKQLHPRRSQELIDNRIGTQLCCYRWEDTGCAEWTADLVSNLGMKWERISFDVIEPWREAPSRELGVSIQEVTAAQKHLLTRLRQDGIQICYVLEYWDGSMLSGAQEEGGGYSRFRSEDEIRRYLDYVRYIVRTLKGKVAYYEILNEPDVRVDCNWVRLEDYIHLVEGTIPVIREEDPTAKIIIGATANLVYEDAREYLLGVVNSSVVAHADAVSFHPMYGASPAYDFYREYYYEYPALVGELRTAVATHGFTGELMAEEMDWRTTLNVSPDAPWTYTDITAAKYYARGIVINLGMDIAAGVAGELFDRILPVVAVIKNLCTVMAGHDAIDMPVEIDIDYDGPVAYCAFRYPNGDRMLGVWTDGIAKDEDPGVPATITFPGLTAETITGTDVLHGFEQELVFETDGGNTIIRDLLVKDYPVLIRLSDVTMGPDYEETPGDGFHRLGEPGAGTASDCDGDGVPDDEDYCPDWPGSKEANGC